MICENCNKEHDGSYASGRFCSKECAKAYSAKKINHSELKEAKCICCGKTIHIKKRASIHKCKCEECKNISNKICKCIVCGKEYVYVIKHNTLKFCSNECKNEYKRNRNKYLSLDSKAKISNGAKRSVYVQRNDWRSKNEIDFYELCKLNFKHVTHNESIFNGWDVDIIIYDKHIAVLWNGKWHYEKITKQHSVEQVQNIDTIKIKEIQNCGWIPYIIKDMGKYNVSFVKEQFEKLLKYIKAYETKT